MEHFKTGDVVVTHFETTGETGYGFEVVVKAGVRLKVVRSVRFGNGGYIWVVRRRGRGWAKTQDAFMIDAAAVKSV